VDEEALRATGREPLARISASAVTAVEPHWPEFDPAILNPRGGALALGHPLVLEQ
jgi:acetyl-CoA acyltransferase